MNRDRCFAPFTLALVIAIVLIASGGPMAGFAHAGDHKVVRLKVITEPSGRQVIMVDPSYAKIWRDMPKKPKKIKGETVNYSPYEELFWELRYDPSKGGGSANYFGNVDIECGETEIKVQPNKKPDFPNAEWPYSVTAFACVGDAKAQKVATVDPRIIWKD